MCACASEAASRNRARRRWDGGTVGESFKRFIEPCSCFCAVMELSIDLCGDSCPPARPSGLPRRTRRASQRASASNVQHIPAPSAAKSRRRKVRSMTSSGNAVGEREKSRYTFIYTYTGQRPSMLAVAIGIVLGSTTARILLGGPRGPGSKAWIKRCDYHKSRGDPVALSSHQVATSSPSAHSTTKVLATLQEKTKDEERRPRRTSMEHEEPLPPPAHG